MAIRTNVRIERVGREDGKGQGGKDETPHPWRGKENRRISPVDRPRPVRPVAEAGRLGKGPRGG